MKTFRKIIGIIWKKLKPERNNYEWLFNSHQELDWEQFQKLESKKYQIRRGPYDM